MTKLQESLYNKAIIDIQKFCKKNRIKMPKVCIADVTSKRHKRWCGYYAWGEDTITVIPKACIPPAKTPGWTWHYPRYFTDLSVYGVICHEFGHYLHFKKLHKYDKVDQPDFDSEKPLSNCEYNYIEAIAEMIKLFIVNPDLLRRANPERYRFMTEICKLKPITTQNWKNRLGKNIHPRYVAQCKKRIEATERKLAKSKYV